LTEDKIVAACAYLCGACSCQVKSGNPGYDLLFRAPWSEHLRDGLVVVDKELPPLPGVGQIGETDPVADPEDSPDSLPAPETATPVSPLWWIAGGLLALGLLAGTWFLLKTTVFCK
jgi:hypothetical protein